MLEHHRHTGTESNSVLETKYQEGILSYSMGYHPLFQILKSFHRFKEKPYIISGLLHLVGYLIANIKKEKREVPDDFVAYLREEQLNRIRTLKF